MVAGPKQLRNYNNYTHILAHVLCTFTFALLIFANISFPNKGLQWPVMKYLLRKHMHIKLIMHDSHSAL